MITKTLNTKEKENQYFVIHFFEQEKIVQLESIHFDDPKRQK
jgi:hypothetical protein